ncbi:MAG: acyl-CoA dehydrogenase C-terminal domain-containing protein, partial [Paracoccus sp. (in: a-proteobacteria)]
AETLREATLTLLDRAMPERFAGAVPYLNAFARVLGGHYHLRAAMAGGASHQALARVFMLRVLPHNAGDLAEALAGLDDLTGISDAALAGEFAA